MIYTRALNSIRGSSNWEGGGKMKQQKSARRNSLS